MRIASTRIRPPQIVTGIHVGTGLSESIFKYMGKLDHSGVFCIFDSNVQRFHGKGPLKSILKGSESFRFPAGERFKSQLMASRLLEWLHNHKADRSSIVVGIGGGVVTDISGFVASAYMRGVRFISIPTTLVGQVDAAIGGKTAVNQGRTKNIIGTFYPPLEVFCDSGFLTTLADDQIRDGLVESIKIFAARNSKQFDYYAPRMGDYLENRDLERLIVDAIRLKADIVNDDPFEADLRRVLNFGHTTGHAYEAVTGESHGKSVAFGILVALMLSLERTGLEKRDCDKVWLAITGLYPSYSIKKTPAKKLWKKIQHDKKKTGSTINFVLLKRCGEHVIKSVNYREFARAIDAARERLKS